MSTWFNLAAIALGGAAGSVCRYGLTVAAAAIPMGTTMLGTTVANVAGCAILGGLTALGEFESDFSQRILLALRVGFLGSLTTFSTFVAESSVLADNGRWWGMGSYLMANLALGWLVLVLASSLVREWIQPLG